MPDVTPLGVTDNLPQSIHQEHLLHDDLRAPLTFPSDLLLNINPQVPPSHDIVDVTLHVRLRHDEVDIPHVFDPRVERLGRVVVDVTLGKVSVTLITSRMDREGFGDFRESPRISFPALFHK